MIQERSGSGSPLSIICKTGCSIEISCARFFPQVRSIDCHCRVVLNTISLCPSHPDSRFEAYHADYGECGCGKRGNLQVSSTSSTVAIGVKIPDGSR
jgi:hypothetical protein